MKNLFRNKSLIITSDEYSKIIFEYKNKHNELDIKVINKEELLNKLSFSYVNNPIKILIKNGIEYTKAKKWLNVLRVANIDKNEDLRKVFNLIKENIKIDEYGIFELQRYDIYLFEMNEDVEIKNVIKRKLNKEVTNINFSDLDIKENESFNKINVIYFDNKFTQYFNILSNIRKRIIDDEKIKDKIIIEVKDDFDIFYLNIVSSLFKIPIIYNVKKPFISIKEINEKIKDIYKNKTYSFTDTELENENIKLLNKVIKDYELDSITDFEFSYSNLLEIVSSMSYLENSSKKGIQVESRYTFKKDYLYYVTNFEFGDFYKVYLDNNVLEDSILETLSVNTSYIKTLLDKRLKLNYIKYLNIQMLSRVKEHLTDSIYDSQFITELNLKDNNRIKDGNIIDENSVLTSESNVIYLSNYLDKEFYNKEIKEYGINSYDHSFKGIGDTPFINKDYWSITNLESYIDCPYKYYLNYLIPSKDDDKHAMYRGTLIHKVFEKFNNNDFDFEVEFLTAKKEYIENIKDDPNIDLNKENLILELIHNGLSDTVKTLSLGKPRMTLLKSMSEVKVNFDLIDDEGNVYPFRKGSIDKILVTEKNGKKYFTIIDYKTGKECFDIDEVCLGRSTQLPLYYYAIMKNHLFDDAHFGGFGIIHNYFSSYKNQIEKDKSLSEKNLLDNSKLKGLIKNDEDYILSYDNEPIRNKENTITKSPFISLNDTFSSVDKDAEEKLTKQGNIQRYNFNDMVTDAVKVTIKNIKRIKANDFKINPAPKKLLDKKNDELKCTYCMYKDICYHNKNDYHDFYSDMIKRFYVKEEDDNNA